MSDPHFAAPFFAPRPVRKGVAHASLACLVRPVERMQSLSHLRRLLTAASCLSSTCALRSPCEFREVRDRSQVLRPSRLEIVRRSAAWVADSDVPQDESHAHH